MRKFVFALALGVLLCALPAAAQTPTTWWIRPDGGTRYSAKQTQGQCDGKADVAYPGKGTNQHCAFGDYRYLWDDRSYGNSAWVIAGGDTVIIRGGPWRVGFNQGASANDVWCLGGNGNNACVNPTIPAGTAAQHTRILGENYAACGTSTATDKTKLTEIFGGFGAWMALNLNGAQFVDIGCLGVASHPQCVVHGSPALPKSCNTSYPVDDYDSSGISTTTGTHDVLLQDVWVHGHTDRGIKGPIGGAVTCNRCEIDFNGMAGLDLDDGTGSNNGNGTASLPGSLWTLHYTHIDWNGCNQEYPIVHAIPAAACYSQSTGGYGDGVATPPGMCLAMSIDHSTFNNNTQDGLDLGHLDTGTGCPLMITTSQAIGNGGQTFKWGPNENPVVFTNNFAMANARRMSQPITGAPAGYNANLSDFLRAGDNLSFNFRSGGTALVANNTVIGYQPTSYDVQCWDMNTAGTARSCPGSMLTFKNNITVGYDNPATYTSGGQAGGVGGLLIDSSIGVTRAGNVWFRMRPTSFTCPTGFAGELCADPLFVNEPSGQGTNFVETELDNFNTALVTGSPAAGDGIAGTVTQTTPPPPSPPVTTPPTPAPSPAPTPVAKMANAVQVCPEGSTITAASVSTFVAQFGSGTTWEPSFSFTASLLPFYVYYTTPPINAFDPAPGVGKQLAAQQQASPYTVTCNNSSTPVTVPALPPPPAPSVTCTKPIVLTPTANGLVMTGCN